MNTVLCLGLCAMAAAAPGDVSVSVTLEPPVTPFHKQALFSIVVEAPAPVDVRLPDMVDGFGDLAIYGLPTFETTAIPGGRLRTTEVYTLDPVFTGEYAIDPVKVTWGEGQETVVPSPVLRVRDLTDAELVMAMHFDSALAEPSFTGPSLMHRLAFWAALVLGAAVAASFAYRWWRRRPEEALGVPSREPWEIAYDRLRVLDQRQFAKAGKFGPFYVDLSSIVRYYIEDRFHIHAPEQTTPEFLVEVTGGDVLSEAQQRLLGALLRHCDRVKFAQYRPGLAEMEQSFSEVLRFVDETVPAPEPGKKEVAA